MSDSGKETPASASGVDVLDGLKENSEKAPGVNLLAGVGTIWENDEVIRGQLLQTGSLLKWPNEKMIGVISFTTAAHNARVLWHVLETWCQQVAEPKTVKIEDVRREAGQIINSSLSNNNARRI